MENVPINKVRSTDKMDISENIFTTEKCTPRRSWRSVTPENRQRTKIRRYSYNTFQITTGEEDISDNSANKCRLSISSFDKSKTENSELILKLPIYLHSEEPLGHSTLCEDADFDDEISPIRSLSSTRRSLSENSIFLPDDVKSPQINITNDLNTAFIKNESVK